MEKLLFIVPHLSTGGMPQYLLKQIQEFVEEYSITVIEYNELSTEYVVQKNKIKNICELITLNDDKTEIINIIKNIDPHIIHFQEIPETFIDENILNLIFNGYYYRIITTHSSLTNPSKIKFIPDKFVLVSDWSYQKFKTQFPYIDCDIWEYPIDNINYNKDLAKMKLNFDHNYRHVLNVGLFTEGKNQKEIIDIAKICELLGLKIIFHFVGNMAENFQHYWGELLTDLPKNCIIHGEKSNVDDYYKASDLFFFPSKFELNPIAIKEALSYGLPTLIRKLETYGNSYDNLVKYIDNNIDRSVSLIINTLKLNKDNFRIQFKILSDNTHSLKFKNFIKTISNNGMDVIMYPKNVYLGEVITSTNLNNSLTDYNIFLYHTRALRDIDEKNYDYTIIMEDNVILLHDFFENLKKIIMLCENDDSIFYINLGQSEIKEKYNDSTHIAGLNSSTYCYLIPNKHKKWILNKINNVSWESLTIWYDKIASTTNKKRLTLKEPITKSPTISFKIIKNE